MSSFIVHSISSKTAQAAITAAAEFAIGHDLKMSIAVADSAGHLKAFLRMDGASQISLGIAQDKAYTAAATAMATHSWHDFIANDPPLLHGFVHTPRLIVFGGGYPIFESGSVIGAIGVSGGHYSQDMECARAALNEIGAVFAA
jgi:uncharacterized protein GlcG (DUF336 family)